MKKQAKLTVNINILYSVNIINDFCDLLGLTVSLMTSLKRSLNFTTTFVQPEDGHWGAYVYDEDTNSSSWTGMIRLIMDRQVDIGTPGFSVSSERAEES